MTESLANDVVASRGEGYLVGSLLLLVFLGIVLLLLGGGLGLSLPGSDVLELVHEIVLELIDGDLAGVDGDLEDLGGSEWRGGHRGICIGTNPSQLGDPQVLHDHRSDALEELVKREDLAELLEELGAGLLFTLEV